MSAQRRRLSVVNQDRAQSARALILACKATTCQWDVLNGAMYVGQDRNGRTVWVHRIRCVRCGSVRVAHYPPRRTRTADRLGGYKYLRPPGWEEIHLYYGNAMQALVDEGMVALGEPPEE